MGLVQKNDIFSKICIDKTHLKYYNNHCRKTKASFKYLENADVAELADAQDLKSCG